MDKRQFLRFLESGDFASLFIEAGWNRPASNIPFSCEIGAKNKSFVFKEIAELYVRVLVCETDSMPLTAERNALDTRLRKRYDAYIAIFVHKGTPMHHLWMVPVKSADKRSLVRIEYQESSQADFLYGKFQELQFPIGEVPDAMDVLDRLNHVFQINAADVTKKFYKEFRQKHSAFVKGILNIMDKSDCEWYASVMLNRLMFCYFIQKKGFLDLDQDYLSHKLAYVQQKKGEDQFYGTFYKDFLRVLFADGLNKREHSAEFEEKFGRIPYLNGGMFEVHKLEEKYPDIDIPDSVFEDLFAFFDQWRWHLDTSLTATGKDINPDVLGYIFEQYINDRAQMGAYYTKEDITEYIARNTIVPWLFNETEKKSPDAFRTNGAVWQTLRESHDDYIFPAVRKGVDKPLPDEIEIGVAVEPQETLRARRAEWNKPADDDLALPTEIWRETVARRQRCLEVRNSIASGGITNINDFITYNLDISKFAENLLTQTTDHLFVRHFYDALCRVTILDPTCGSGAFLFAALNILEPLYEICLTRMQEDWPNYFKEELSDLKTKYRGNLKYCIYKNIILRNLYGVDIMREATEIARLRLFLKMVAVVDVDEMADNLGLEPLPDIDFNIRCGNTLVGYSTEKEIQDGLVNGDIFAYTELKNKINDELLKNSLAQKQFRDAQMLPSVTNDELHQQKMLLLQRLESIQNLLNNQLYASEKQKTKEQWINNTHPFHWYAEFYQIMTANCGFDVIIGNPPYLELTKVNNYKLHGYSTLACNNLYACILERVQVLRNEKSRMGMIVPISISSSGAYQSLRNCIITEKDDTYFAHFSNRPSQLFEGAQNRLSILTTSPAKEKSITFTTNYLRWDTQNGEREILFENIYYSQGEIIDGVVAKFGNMTYSSIFTKIFTKTPLSISISSIGTYKVYWVRVPGYFCQFFRNPLMAYTNSGESKLRGEMLALQFDTELIANAAFAALNSTLFYMYFSALTDTRHINPSDAKQFPIGLREIKQEILLNLSSISLRLSQNYIDNLGYINKSSLKIESINSPQAKSIIDEIDELLAKHYDFTEEELDFIINYDIKYRMGDKLNVED